MSSLWDGGFATRLLLLLLVLFLAGPVIRAAIDGVRTLSRSVRALWRRIVFRFERRWRVEAARLVDASPMFNDVPEEVLGELAGLARLRTFGRGARVFRQGDRPDGFYVVRRGAFEAVEEFPNGTERILRSLERGDTFGELGILEGTPRSATVRAARRSEVFAFDRGAFDSFMADMVEVPDFAPTWQHAAELGALSCFEHLRQDELGELARSGEWMSLPAGERIIEQGAMGDGFFAIVSGRVDVRKNGDYVRTLGAGQHFGELSLLLDVRRTSSVSAKTPVRLFRLDRDGFDRVLRRAFRSGRLRQHPGAGRVEPH